MGAVSPLLAKLITAAGEGNSSMTLPCSSASSRELLLETASRSATSVDARRRRPGSRAPRVALAAVANRPTTRALA
jgi:hypothetical protein